MDISRNNPAMPLVIYGLNKWVSEVESAGRWNCEKNKCVTGLPCSSLSSLYAHCCLRPFKQMLWIQSHTVTAYLHLKMRLLAQAHVCVCAQGALCACISEWICIILSVCSVLFVCLNACLYVNNWCPHLMYPHIYLFIFIHTYNVSTSSSCIYYCISISIVYTHFF